MVHISCNTCPTDACLIKQYCSPQWLNIVDQKKYQTFFSPNLNVFTEISPVLGIYFIQSGIVKILLTGINDKKQIVRFAQKGHFFGHRGSKDEIYGISAVSMEDSLICFLENNILRNMFRENQDFAIGLMMYYSQELRKMENRLKNISQMNIREKIAEALVLLWDTFGSNSKKEINVFHIRDVITNIAGTNIQQVSRQLSDFEIEGLISRGGKKISILNIARLRTIIQKYNQLIILENRSI